MSYLSPTRKPDSKNMFSPSVDDYELLGFQAAMDEEAEVYSIKVAHRR
jgi:hypothetical protein